MYKNTKPDMKKSIIFPFLLIAAALAGQGCPKTEKRPEPKVPEEFSSSCGLSGVADAAAATEQTEEGEHNPNTDPVLGKWVCIVKDNETDQERDARIAFLWPETPEDKRAVGTLSFYNDYIASNGCCATGEWSLYAPRFYKVDRGIHELYYMPVPDKLYFLARAEASASEAFFQKITTSITPQASLEALHKDGVLPVLTEYKHVSNGKRF